MSKKIQTKVKEKVKNLSVRNKMIEQKSQQAAPLNLFNGDNQKNGTCMPNADVRETKDDAGDDPIE